MFRNATIFSLRHIGTDAIKALDLGGLNLCRLREPGPLEMETSGFVSPLGSGSDKLTMEFEGATMVTVGGWKRALPMAAVHANLAKVLDGIEKVNGRRPMGRERKRLLSDVLEKMMPQAPIVPSRVNAIIDPLLQVLIVDTASRPVAENVAHQLRHALGSFNVLPLSTDNSPAHTLTQNVLMSNNRSFNRGSMVELKQPVPNGEVVKITNGELESDEVFGYVRLGLLVSKIEVSTERVSLVLGEDLVLRKLKMLDVVDIPGELEDKDEELQARMVIAVGELRKLIAAVYTLLLVNN